MSKLYFGFALADSMLEKVVTIDRFALGVNGAKHNIARAFENGELVPCLNPSHVPTINAMKKKFGIEVDIPTKAPIVQMESGDDLIVMSVRGLPRLEGRHEYTEEEINSANFTFALYHAR